jgi:hypothetical protein
VLPVRCAHLCWSNGLSLGSSELIFGLGCDISRLSACQHRRPPSSQPCRPACAQSAALGRQIAPTGLSGLQLGCCASECRSSTLRRVFLVDPHAIERTDRLASARLACQLSRTYSQAFQWPHFVVWHFRNVARRWTVRGQDLPQYRTTNGAGRASDSSYNTSGANTHESFDRIDGPDANLSRFLRLHGLRDCRNGSRGAGAVSCICEEARPAVEANGLHCVCDFLGGVPQLGMAGCRPDIDRFVVQLLDNRIVCCPPEESVSELDVRQSGTTAPGSHNLGQPRHIACVILSRCACPERLRQSPDRTMGYRLNALGKPTGAEHASTARCILRLFRAFAVPGPASSPAAPPVYVFLTNVSSNGLSSRKGTRRKH